MRHGLPHQALRTTLIAVCLAIAVSSVNGQQRKEATSANRYKWSILPYTGFATYSLSGVRDYQSYLLAETTLPLTATTKFPAFVIFGADLEYRFDNVYIQIGWQHGSTAGRLWYSDYSGTIRLDQLYRYNAIAFTIGRKINKSAKLEIFAGLRSSLIFNRLKVDNKAVFTGVDVSESAEFAAKSFGVQPHLRFVLHMNNSIYFNASAGYELQKTVELEKSDDKNVFLADQNNDPVTVNGSGLRFTIGCGFLF